MESRIFAALLIGEGNLARATDRFTSCFRVLWVSPFGFNFLASGDCLFFIGRTYLCLYFFLFLFLTFSREGVCLPMSLNVNGAFVSFGLRGLCRLHIGLRS